MAMADIDLKDFAVIGLRSEIARLEAGGSTHLRQACRPKDGPGSLKRHAKGEGGKGRRRGARKRTGATADAATCEKSTA